MKKERGYKVSIVLNIILILFLILYFLFPFLQISFLKTIFKPCCTVIESFQGKDYLPAWCQQKTETPAVINEEKKESTDNKKQGSEESKDEEKTGLANPAAVKCEEDNGTLESYQTEAGEAALCIFTDGSICNQWSYFRGDCQPKQCFKSCEKIGTAEEGWYNSCTLDLLELTQCQGSQDENVEDAASDSVEKNIKVTNPLANQQLTSPFTVEGEARVFENQVLIRVTNNQGEDLINIDTTANSPNMGEWGDFSIDIDYEFSQTKEGYVEVYSESAKDGSDENLIRIPVKF